MLVKWKEHAGRKVMYLDCRGLEVEQMEQILDDAASEMKRLQEKIPVLANVEGAFLSPEFMDRMKKHTRETYVHYSAGTAIVGVEGLKSAILKTYNFLMGRDIHNFQTEDEALEWLVNQ